MTQLPLELTPPEATKPWRRVRETSKAAYADGRARFTGRRGNVLRWLAAYWNRYQESPTSAELAGWAEVDRVGPANLDDSSWLATLLYVRRGLSDLQTTGVVEAVPGGERKCRISNRMCCVWRVVSR